MKLHLIKKEFFWQLEIPYQESWIWIWRKIIQMRDAMKYFIRIKVGNGKSTNILFDPWSPKKPLCNMKNDKIFSQSSLRRDLRFSDIVVNGQFSGLHYFT